MFDATVENIELDRITRYELTRDGTVLSYADVLDLWQGDSEFCRYYIQLLADSPYPAYRWETPALTGTNVTQAFQFVLLNCPGFCSRKTDPRTYERYFTPDDRDDGIVSFANLGGDATLVVPSPRTDRDAYGHLAAFIRHAPRPQLEALWRVVATAARDQLGERPVWLSTAGGGVAWLHVRLDARPKYYGYTPYKTV